MNDSSTNTAVSLRRGILSASGADMDDKPRTDARCPGVAGLAVMLRGLVVGAVLAIPLALASAQLPPQAPAPQPRYAPFAPGLLSRKRLTVDSASSRHVEIWDLLVGPRMRTRPATLPGGAVLEIRAGAGRLTLDGKEREIRRGETFAVAEGASIAFVNSRNDLGLAIRAVIISARRR